ncbi:hypothetical protein HK101_009270 [Irineochytrium annulatum]|nr:hypothetical protein HK101_009270 [Irineochytrium annulatum]
MQAPRFNGSHFDLAVVVSFGYRGAAPIQHTILNGDKETGVSIIDLDDREFDAGLILNQSRMEVPKYVFYKDLHDKLANQGAKDLVHTMEHLEDFRRDGVVQLASLATKAPKIKKEMSEVHWDSMSAADIYRLHRAIGYKVCNYTSSPNNTAGFKIPISTTFQGKRTHLLTLINPDLNEPERADATLKPGEFLAGSGYKH